VPTAEDFCALDKFLNNSSSCSNERSGVAGSVYISTWGGSYGGSGGVRDDGTLWYLGEWTFYWAMSEIDEGLASSLGFTPDRVYPDAPSPKWWGLQVRCVM
jgi:hypothetical protein